MAIKKGQKMVDIEIDGIERQTGKAILAIIGEEEVWLPKSQIEFDVDAKHPEDTVIVKVAEWLAIEKGLV